jgi:SAM-dependent methyltransferase
MRDPTRRFSDRVSDYVRYRPGYPVGVLELLRTRCGLGRGAVVADVGSGTGKLTELLLSTGWTVYAVEPNAEMRAAAEALLGGRPGFRSVHAAAEATTLAPRSVDLVTAAQAFHWFDQPAARTEFRRILREPRHVALVWNDRDLESPFAEEYERLVARYSSDYGEVDRAGKTGLPAMEAFFGVFDHASFPNPQETDFAGLVGRYLSSSYALRRDHPRFPEAEAALRQLFDANARDGRVSTPLTTHVYWGRV